MHARANIIEWWNIFESIQREGNSTLVLWNFGNYRTRNLPVSRVTPTIGMPLVQIRVSANRSIDPFAFVARRGGEYDSSDWDERRRKQGIGGDSDREGERASGIASPYESIRGRNGEEREREEGERREKGRLKRHIRSIYFPGSLLSSCPPGSRFLAGLCASENKKKTRSSVRVSFARICTASAIIQRVLLDPRGGVYSQQRPIPSFVDTGVGTREGTKI